MNDIARTDAMDAETLTALRGSIKKWKGIVDGTVEDHGAENCPLCIKFMQRDDDGQWESCGACPVAKAAGGQGCENTPYDDYQNDETVESAQAEIDFLESLLPPEVDPTPWCSGCGAMKQKDCHCGPIAENN